jgi:hypothetical protein
LFLHHRSDPDASTRASVFGTRLAIQSSPGTRASRAILEAVAEDRVGVGHAVADDEAAVVLRLVIAALEHPWPGG